MKIIVRSFEKKFVGSQDSTGLKGLNVAGTKGFTNNMVGASLDFFLEEWSFYD